ncbi:hypothetical protein ABS71_10515 [bacterium SCN 62-11]|nr:MAG: hypothetical protein ABS71_10515 [bacterium SCN 62-11]
MHAFHSNPTKRSYGTLLASLQGDLQMGDEYAISPTIQSFERCRLCLAVNDEAHQVDEGLVRLAIQGQTAIVRIEKLHQLPHQESPVWATPFRQVITYSLPGPARDLVIDYTISLLIDYNQRVEVSFLGATEDSTPPGAQQTQPGPWFRLDWYANLQDANQSEALKAASKLIHASLSDIKPPFRPLRDGG